MLLLDELKSYLWDLNYPGINIMQDNEIAEIFSKKNRLYFLTWFVQQWDEDLALPTDEKSKENELADILCDNGFCTSQESKQFVQDDLKLTPDRQLAITHRMLYNLCLLKSEQSSSNTCNTDCAEQMKVLSVLDLNIFPELGPIQSRKTEERVRKFQELQEQMEELKNELKCYNVEDYNENLNTPDKNDSDSSNLIKDVSILMNNSLILLKDRKNENEGIFDQHFETIVTSCHRSISHVLQLHESKKSIGAFCMDSSHPEESDHANDVIKRLSILSQEILLID